MAYVYLRMPTIDFDIFEGTEIWFREGEVLRPLKPDEWKAYFPGCDYPVSVRRRATGTEEVWRQEFPMNILDDARRVGIREAVFTAWDKAGDGVPSLVESLSRLSTRGTGRLFGFVSEFHAACERWPDASVGFVWA